MLTFTRRAIADDTVRTTLTLPYEQRIKCRLRVTLDDGSDAGIMLERGTALRDGDCITSEDGVTVRVRAAAETVSCVRCADPLLLARACYHLGNRHVPLQIDPGLLRYQHDHVLDDMLRGLDLEVTVEQAPFEPEPGAYSGHGHTHGHEHDREHAH